MKQEEMQERIEKLERENKELRVAGNKIVIATRVYMTTFSPVAHFAHQEQARSALNNALYPWESDAL